MGLTWEEFLQVVSLDPLDTFCRIRAVSIRSTMVKFSRRCLGSHQSRPVKDGPFMLFRPLSNIKKQRWSELSVLSTSDLLHSAQKKMTTNSVDIVTCCLPI